eukprot:8035275-Alexandrium_andersonii.AAC.1
MASGVRNVNCAVLSSRPSWDPSAPSHPRFCRWGGDRAGVGRRQRDNNPRDNGACSASSALFSSFG